MNLRSTSLFLLLAFLMAGAASADPGRIPELARSAPADAWVFAAYVHPGEAPPDLASWKSGLDDETARRLAEVEDWAGTRAEELFGWARPAGFGVLLPGQGAEASPEWAVALALRDEAAARKAVARFAQRHSADLALQEGTREGVAMLAPAEGAKGPALAVQRGFLLVGTPAGVARTALAASDGAGALASQASFAEALRRVPAERGAFLFAPARRALAGLEAPFGAIGSEIVAAARGFDFVVAGEVRRGDRTLTETFLKLDPRASSPLVWSLMIPTRPSRDLAGWFPGDVALFGSFDLDLAYRPAMALLRWGGGAAALADVVGPLDQLLDALGGRLAYAADGFAFPGPGEGPPMPSLLVAAGVRDAAGVDRAAARLEREYGTARPDRAYETCQSNLRTLSVGLEMFSTDGNGRYPRELAELPPNYLRAIPTCPAAGTDTYSPGYEAVDSRYTVVCRGRNHENVGVGPDLPRFDETAGLTAPEPRPGPPLARGSRQVEGATVHSYQDLPLLWTVQGSRDGQVLLASVGPDAEALLARALRARRQGATIAADPQYREMTDDAEGTVVATAFVRGRALLESLRDQMALAPPEVRGVLARMALDDVVGYVTMEEGGVRSVSTTSLGASLAPAAAVLVPNFVRAREQGQLTACKSNLKNVAVALEMYSTDHSGRYPQELSALTPDYLRAIPTCPSAGADTYSASLRSSVDPESYTVYCQGANHTGAGLPEDYPQFNYVQGLVERP